MLTPPREQKWARLIGITTPIQEVYLLQEHDKYGSLTWYVGLGVGHLSDRQPFEVVYFGEEEICEFDYGKNDLYYKSRCV